MFLTQELSKLLTDKPPDMELFMELASQRDKMQEMIEQHPDSNYAFTPAGKAILTDIDNENQAICLRLQLHMNRLNTNEKLNNAYNAIGTTYTGKRMDYQK